MLKTNLKSKLNLRALLVAAVVVLGLTLSVARPVYADTLRLDGSNWLGGQGVDVYGGGDGTWNSVNGVQTGLKWQCVELINRLYLSKGWISSRWVGDGNELYASAPASLSKQPNGSITSIKPGDVVAMNDGGFGHAAIVNSVSGSTVQVVNQNTQSVYSTATLSGGTLSNFLSGYTVQGVIHAPAGNGTSGGDTIGLKRNNTYFLNNGHDGTEEVLFNFGQSTDTPLSGDWNGDGRNTVGVKRGNTFFLNNGHDGTEEIVFNFGQSGDIPIVGDWDGDGDDNIGLKRGNTYFLNYGHDGTEEKVFNFGQSPDKPIAGDWNNDNKDTIGLKRGNTYFLNNGHDGTEEVVFNFGQSTDTPVAGDWNEDGKDTVGVKRGNTYFLNNGHDGTEEVRFNFGQSTDIPLAGNWDNN